MLTQATQAAIAILHDISTGIYFRSANFRFTEEEWENLFHKLEVDILYDCYRTVKQT